MKNPGSNKIEMLSDKEIKSLLKNSKTIAVVGISRDRGKPSHKIPKYLKEKGYKIIPINPFADKVLGEKSLKSLAQVKDTVDIVDIFRPGDEVYEIVKQAVALKPKIIWMQSGIKNIKAKKYAEKYNIAVVMDKCLGKEHHRLVDKDKPGTGIFLK